VTAFIAAGAGFLLAVLWFDLMFDIQAWRVADPELPEAVLSSIAGYYRRVTTAARPMNRLVALAMAETLGTIVAQIVRCESPRWVGWLSLALTVAPVGLAAAHTVPAAVRLGSRRDCAEQQSRLARSILRDHTFCASAIVALLAVQLSSA
jgi:hypothetical protein